MSAEGTTERVLRLLALLQRRTSWTARELAEELQVTDRCVRRDVERLRALGYPVQATAGVGGGYRLGSGTRLPPLLLDDEEAIATAVSLRLAAGGTVTGAADAAVRVLAKLDQVMPPRLRGSVRAVHESTETLVGPGTQIDPDTLLTIARACRDRIRLHFAYSSGEQHTERTVEPIRMVATGRRWYLMAWDIHRTDWRTFRLDRMSGVSATGWQFRPRDHPDPVGYVQQAVSQRPYRFLARVRVHAEADRLRELVPPQTGTVQPDRDGWSVLTAGGDDLEWMAMHLVRLELETQILDPPELRRAAAALAERLTALSGNIVTSADTNPPDPAVRDRLM